MKKVFCFILCYILCLCVLFATLRIANAEDRIVMENAGIDVEIYVKDGNDEHSKYCSQWWGQYCCHSSRWVDPDHLALCQMTREKTWHVCDHNTQDFKDLQYVEVGDVIYMDVRGERTYYVCVDKGFGLSNDDGKYYAGADHDWKTAYRGIDIWKWAWKVDGYSYPLICSTCTGVKGRILVVVFDIYEEEN